MKTSKILTLTLMLATVLLAACAKPTITRHREGSKDYNKAMSLKLDDKDIQDTVAEIYKKGIGSEDFSSYASEGKKPRIAIAVMVNETGRHINTERYRLAMQKVLFKSKKFRIMFENKAALIKRIRTQSGIAFNAEKAANLGKMLGAKFVTFGKITGETEEGLDRDKRVQYRIYIQMVNVETSELIMMEDAYTGKDLKNN